MAFLLLCDGNTKPSKDIFSYSMRVAEDLNNLDTNILLRPSFSLLNDSKASHNNSKRIDYLLRFHKLHEFVW